MPKTWLDCIWWRDAMEELKTGSSSHDLRVRIDGLGAVLHSCVFLCVRVWLEWVMGVDDHGKDNQPTSFAVFFESTTQNIRIWQTTARMVRHGHHGMAPTGHGHGLRAKEIEGDPGGGTGTTVHPRNQKRTRKENSKINFPFQIPPSWIRQERASFVPSKKSLRVN